MTFVFLPTADESGPERAERIPGTTPGHPWEGLPTQTRSPMNALTPSQVRALLAAQSQNAEFRDNPPAGKEGGAEKRGREDWSKHSFIHKVDWGVDPNPPYHFQFSV